jgi:hypothetical protein
MVKVGGVFAGGFRNSYPPSKHYGVREDLAAKCQQRAFFVQVNEGRRFATITPKAVHHERTD